MEYTVTEKLGKDLKAGDVVWHNDSWITVKEGDYLNIISGQSGTPFLCRVPSSPVMSFEEEFKQWWLTDGKLLCGERNMQQVKDLLHIGYLIGTRSIVPEIKEDKILVIVKDSIEKWKEAKDVSTHQTMANYITQRIYNWLRSQINK